MSCGVGRAQDNSTWGPEAVTRSIPRRAGRRAEALGRSQAGASAQRHAPRAGHGRSARQVLARPRAAASRRRGTARTLDAECSSDRRGGEMQRGARGRVIQRPQPIAAAAVEQPDELGAAAAMPARAGFGELALDLAARSTRPLRRRSPRGVGRVAGEDARRDPPAGAASMLPRAWRDRAGVRSWDR